jgi:hypothetical protein
MVESKGEGVPGTEDDDSSFPERPRGAVAAGAVDGVVAADGLGGIVAGASGTGVGVDASVAAGAREARTPPPPATEIDGEAGGAAVGGTSAEVAGVAGGRTPGVAGGCPAGPGDAPATIGGVGATGSSVDGAADGATSVEAGAAGEAGNTGAGDVGVAGVVDGSGASGGRETEGSGDEVEAGRPPGGVSGVPPGTASGENGTAVGRASGPESTGVAVATGRGSPDALTAAFLGEPSRGAAVGIPTVLTTNARPARQRLRMPSATMSRARCAVVKMLGDSLGGSAGGRHGRGRWYTGDPRRSASPSAAAIRPATSRGARGTRRAPVP